MKLVKIILMLILAIALLDQNCAFPTNIGEIYFDDSAPNTLLLGNDYFEAAFRKSNGSLLYLVDKSTGQAVTDGSRNECLWGAVFYDATIDYMGGCLYNANWSNQFAYTWLPDVQKLVFDFTPDPNDTQGITAQVAIIPSQSNWLDLTIHLQNDWSYTLDDVLFPSDLLVMESDVEELLLPVLPGVILEPGFFTDNRSFEAEYPGLFADYLSLQSVKGSLAIYSIRDQTIIPSRLGFHDGDVAGDRGFLTHTFHPQVKVGNSWESPIVRVRVSESHTESAAAYRIDNDLNGFSPLSDKLGDRYETVVSSPLFKLGFNQPFSQYQDAISHIPAPGILHMVSFWNVGFDENYPDFLPPNPDYGTQTDLINLMQQAQAAGFLIMPYTNPTWWDDESPTVQTLPPLSDLEDIAALNEQGDAIYECYTQHPAPPPCNPENAARDSVFNQTVPPNLMLHGGNVVSPYSPFVQQRLNQLTVEMTQVIPSDLIFEDQIGARSTIFDHNAQAPSLISYPQGWLEHTRVFSPTLLMTESGTDYLAETEVGFHGSVLLAQESGQTDTSWGEGNWRPFPLAPMLGMRLVKWCNFAV